MASPEDEGVDGVADRGQHTLLSVGVQTSLAVDVEVGLRRINGRLAVVAASGIDRDVAPTLDEVLFNRRPLVQPVDEIVVDVAVVGHDRRSASFRISGHECVLTTVGYCRSKACIACSTSCWSSTATVRSSQR